ncbi:hypothetical protein AURDEDRAFT_129364 [Auricularia subglabra TFB-10046 SS5]|uniref:Uncharacterized protein n=1 Tax=Auricularia subglabra (strain TFB-10046 / SS5) TaxID=717982 RepID=J0LHP2_AURST|nr:hypothetical protein AURDEDRAFT_129364 [Auricularia subglabra TFB-10046 SS5]
MVSLIRLVLITLLAARPRAQPGDEPEIVLASDTERWVLSADANATFIRRSQIASFCPPPAGEENETVILAGRQPLAGFRQITLPFPAFVVEVVFYGAVIGEISPDDQEESIYAEWDEGVNDATRRSPIPKSSFDPKTKAACDIVVFDFADIGSDIHAISLNTYDDGQQIAIYNASLFTRPRQSTPTGTGEPSSSGSATPVSSQSPSVTSDAVAGVSRTSETQGTPRTSSLPPSHAGSDLPPPHSSSPVRIIAIVVPSILIPVVLIFLYLWARTRRRRTNEGLRPYLEAAVPSEAPPAKGDKLSPSMSPYILSGPSRIPPEGDRRSRKPVEMTQARRLEDDRSESPVGDDAVGDDLASEDPAQIEAIQRAMRRAGFSAQALLRSLNRVHPDPGSQDELSSAAPPRYDA